MTNPGDDASKADLIRVVLADANVLYSRVLRDYLLYAADQEIIAITWSPQILAETTDHLTRNVAGFDNAAAQRLVRAMNHAFPYAEINPGPEHLQMLAEVSLPDENDRHVLAAALAAEATVLCTSNTKDFPASIADPFGIDVVTPDQLLSRLVDEFQPQMLAAHQKAVASLNGATDESTVRALGRAGASKTAALMARLLGIDKPPHRAHIAEDQRPSTEKSHTPNPAPRRDERERSDAR
ncbi:PIN domain-containing protein [Allorhizocola rhizosphaerae]|uniref:PIN domain-containing protein n=1 Tax=Allorhizocola rhizosphaerae TaxID=1872709 RepID=UPI000E3CD86F|nr:PIN domain-containing protein [Allorhizocola rhizosphaerae]